MELLTAYNKPRADKVRLYRDRIVHIDSQNPDISAFMLLTDIDLNAPCSVLTPIEFFDGQTHMVFITPFSQRLGCLRFDNKNWKKIVRAVKAAKEAATTNGKAKK